MATRNQDLVRQAVKELVVYKERPDGRSQPFPLSVKLTSLEDVMKSLCEYLELDRKYVTGLVVPHGDTRVRSSSFRKDY